MLNIHFDPFDKFSLSESELKDICSILTIWLMALEGTEREDLLEQLANMYGFGKLYEMEGGYQRVT